MVCSAVEQVESASALDPVGESRVASSGCMGDDTQISTSAGVLGGRNENGISNPSCPASRRVGADLRSGKRDGRMPREDGTSLNRCKVAVIGAGASGLVAARELIREGHRVVIYEQWEEVGGLWVYDPNVENDSLGVRSEHGRVRSSMYASLRTNLPREVMGFLDYPFLSKVGRDARRYAGHREVALYLQDFAKDFDLLRFTRFGVKVDYVGPIAGKFNAVETSSAASPDELSKAHRGDLPHGEKHADLAECDDKDEGIREVLTKTEDPQIRWVVRSSSARRNSSRGRAILSKIEDFKAFETQGSASEVELFDAVVVCNGHYSEPRISHLPGIECWPGVQMHSSNYRLAHTFSDKVVVVIGNAASGEDISREIAEVAKEVHICGRSWKVSFDKLSKGAGAKKNLWQHPMVTRAYEDGTVEFQDGTSAVADIILYCTGYLYSFPFLDTGGIISVDNNRVHPLYKHVISPDFGPSLSFVGLPWKVAPFPLFELQSKWVAKILAGGLRLPSRIEMLGDLKDVYDQLEASGIPKEHTHCLGFQNAQFEYADWLALQCEHEPVETWRKEMFGLTLSNRLTNPETYRDNLIDQHWQEVAMKQFLSSN